MNAMSCDGFTNILISKKQSLQWKQFQGRQRKDDENEEKVRSFFFIIDVDGNQTKQTDKNVETKNEDRVFKNWWSHSFCRRKKIRK